MQPMPLHVQYAADTADLVLEGALDILWAEDRKEARASSHVYMPDGTPHGFRVTGESGARYKIKVMSARTD